MRAIHKLMDYRRLHSLRIGVAGGKFGNRTHPFLWARQLAKTERHCRARAPGNTVSAKQNKKRPNQLRFGLCRISPQRRAHNEKPVSNRDMRSCFEVGRSVSDSRLWIQARQEQIISKEGRTRFCVRPCFADIRPQPLRLLRPDFVPVPEPVG
jgi:hypothetical protein